MVGGIENGATSVSTATLDRIGIALNATLADLVAEPSSLRSARVDRVGWHGDKGGEGVLRWSIDARREVELWEWRLEPGERYQAAADPAGWHVMIFVVEGCLTLELETGTIEVMAGNHVFDSAQKHAFANTMKGPVRFFRCTACASIAAVIACCAQARSSARCAASEKISCACRTGDLS